MTQEEKNIEKKVAAERAVDFVKDDMTIGLGTGSTVFFSIMKIGELVRAGLNIKAVSTSDATKQLSESEGINIISIDDAGEIDLTIDGADEVDRSFNGIKGGGGALLFEKIVALSSKKNIWIVDSAKLVNKLGKFPLPVEVIPFGYKRVFKIIEEMKLRPVIRLKGDDLYFTDSGNLVFDLHIREINDPVKLNEELKLINGIVETGLFINIADIVVVGRNNSTEIFNK